MLSRPLWVTTPGAVFIFPVWKVRPDADLLVTVAVVRFPVAILRWHGVGCRRSCGDDPSEVSVPG